jgi:hypothetical protein
VFGYDCGLLSRWGSTEARRRWFFGHLYVYSRFQRGHMTEAIRRSLEVRRPHVPLVQGGVLVLDYLEGPESASQQLKLVLWSLDFPTDQIVEGFLSYQRTKRTCTVPVFAVRSS